MIPARFAHVTFGFFLTMIMSAIISGVSALSAVGLTSELPALWFRAWYSSWAIAFPAFLVVAPFVRWLVARITTPPA